MTSAKMSSSRNNNATALKQGTLAFSAKRTNSHTTTKTKGPPVARRSSSLIDKHTAEDAADLETDDEEDSSVVLEISSEEEYSPAPVKRSGAINATKASISSSIKRLKDHPSVVHPVEQRPTLDVTGKTYRKHYGQVREKLGHLEPSESAICAYIVHEVQTATSV